MREDEPSCTSAPGVSWLVGRRLDSAGPEDPTHVTPLALLTLLVDDALRGRTICGNAARARPDRAGSRPKQTKKRTPSPRSRTTTTRDEGRAAGREAWPRRNAVGGPEPRLASRIPRAAWVNTKPFQQLADGRKPTSHSARPATSSSFSGAPRGPARRQADTEQNHTTKTRGPSGPVPRPPKALKGSPAVSRRPPADKTFPP